MKATELDLFPRVGLAFVGCEDGRPNALVLCRHLHDLARTSCVGTDCRGANGCPKAGSRGRLGMFSTEATASRWGRPRRINQPGGHEPRRWPRMPIERTPVQTNAWNFEVLALPSAPRAAFQMPHWPVMNTKKPKIDTSAQDAHPRRRQRFNCRAIGCTGSAGRWAQPTRTIGQGRSWTLVPTGIFSRV